MFWGNSTATKDTLYEGSDDGFGKRGPGYLLVLIAQSAGCKEEVLPSV